MIRECNVLRRKRKKDDEKVSKVCTLNELIPEVSGESRRKLVQIFQRSALLD